MKLRIDCEKVQLVNATNGDVYLVTPDGAMFVLRDDAANRLRQKYSEQSSAQEWEFHVELNVQVAKPVAHPALSQEPRLPQEPEARSLHDRFLLACFFS